MPRSNRWTSNVVLRFILVAVIAFSVSFSLWLSGSVLDTYHCHGDADSSSTISQNRCHDDASISPPRNESFQQVPDAPTNDAHHVGLPLVEIANTTTTSPQAEQQRLPVRILLGISTSLDDVVERQRRHLIRNTYLDFDRLHRPDQPNRVCSLQDYLSQNNNRNDDDGPDHHRDHHDRYPLLWQSCQLIYTFVLRPTEGNLSSWHDRGAELPNSMFEENQHEKDVIYVNVNKTDMVGKRWSWFRYASSVMKSATTMNNPLLAAYTDAHVLIKPTSFWESNPLFSMDPSTLKGIYAGLATSKEDCPKKRCDSLLRETLMRRFVLLSSDLVHHVASQPIPNLAATDLPDVAIANALQSYPAYPIQEIALKGLVPKVSRQDSVGYFLNFFDHYKDAFVDYRDPHEVALMQVRHPTLLKKSNSSSSELPPRFLLGIFSMDSPIELERREVIRNTYLKAFLKTDTPRRICSLMKLETTEHPEECQIAYAFVVSGNPGGPTELVDVSDSTGPIALENESLPSSIRLPDHNKHDIVYLNIQENGKEGKSQTYFKFATTLLDEQQHYFDYLIKTDSDTLLYPKSLFNQPTIWNLPKFPHNVRVYGGDYRIKPSKASLNLGPTYMGGHWYFMSPDLARYITSPACNRTALARYSEDQSIGNFVHSLAKPIRRIWVPPSSNYDHPIKRVDRMRTLWNKRNSKGKN